MTARDGLASLAKTLGGAETVLRMTARDIGRKKMSPERATAILLEVASALRNLQGLVDSLPTPLRITDRDTE